MADSGRHVTTYSGRRVTIYSKQACRGNNLAHVSSRGDSGRWVGMTVVGAYLAHVDLQGSQRALTLPRHALQARRTALEDLPGPVRQLGDGLVLHIHAVQRGDAFAARLAHVHEFLGGGGFVVGGVVEGWVGVTVVGDLSGSDSCRGFELG